MLPHIDIHTVHTHMYKHYTHIQYECVRERVIVRPYCEELWVATGYNECAK